MDRDAPTLGARIRRARERARLSQEELANAVGASVRAVGDWENDRRKPRNRLGALEDVLGVSLSEDAPEPDPVPPELAEMPEMVAKVRRRYPDPADQARVLGDIARAIRGEPPRDPPTEPGEGGRSGWWGGGKAG